MLFLVLLWTVWSLDSQDRWTGSVTWIKQRAPTTYVNDKLRLTEGPFGVVPTASAPLAYQELLLRIPLEGLFLWDDCFPSGLPLPTSSLRSPIGVGFTSIEMISERTKLAMCLLVHRLLQHNSSFWPWIKTLPTKVNNFYNMSLDDSRVLRGTCAYQVLTKEHRAIQNETELLWPMFEEFVRDYQLNATELDKEMFAKLFRQAGSLVQSRCFNLTSTQILNATFPSMYFPSLVPLLEMFNHGPTSLTNCRYRWKNHSMELLTTREISAGEELILSYGFRSNAQLVTAYGFMLPNHPEDFVLVEDLGQGALEYNLQQTLGKGDNLCDILYFPPAPESGWEPASLASLCPSPRLPPAAPSSLSCSPALGFPPPPTCTGAMYACRKRMHGATPDTELRNEFQLRRQIMEHGEGPPSMSFIFPDTLLGSTATILRLSVVSPLSSFMVHRILSSPLNQLHPLQEHQVMKTLLVFCIDQLSIRLHSLGLQVNREGEVLAVGQRLLHQAQAATEQDGTLPTLLAKSELRVMSSFCSAVEPAARVVM